MPCLFMLLFLQWFGDKEVISFKQKEKFVTQVLKFGDAITVGIGYGSIGCCLIPNSEKEKGIYILTNGHVVANSDGKINMGTKVYYGMAGEGKTISQKVEGLPQIATVTYGLREFNHKYGYVDWALCKILTEKEVEVNNKIKEDEDLVSKIGVPSFGQRVKKLRANAEKLAYIEECDYRDHIAHLPNYPQRNEIPVGQGLIQFQGREFLVAGDSGSLTVDATTHKVLALNFASDEMIFSLGIPFTRILKSLEDKTKSSWRIAPEGKYKDGMKIPHP